MAKYLGAHGLNNRPEIMDRLFEELGLPKEHCAILSLPDHLSDLPSRERKKRMKNTSASVWAQATEAFMTQHRCDDSIFFGFSLGCVLGSHYLAHHTHSFEKMVLFAPALAYRPVSYSVRLLKKLPTWEIPSLTPERVRAVMGIPIAVYNGLFDLRDLLVSGDLSRLNIPTLIFIDERDELVSPSGLEKFIEEHQLSQWDLHVLPSSPFSNIFKKHLIFEKTYRKPEEWEKIANSIQKFIQ